MDNQTNAQGSQTEFKPIAAAVKASAPLDAKVFKAVMRKVAGTVAVFSTSSDLGLHGMTATAMCSVCAEPPTILIVVNRSTRTHPHIDRKKAFTINILSTAQLKTAEVFASKGDDQFAAVQHHRLEDGCPVIDGAAAFLHCGVDQQFDVGTHTIFIGQVLDAGENADAPLVYQDARYGRVVE